jgi:hypothetical protein
VGGTPVPPVVRRVADALLVITAVGVPLSTTVMEGGVIGLIALSALAAVAGWTLIRPTPLDTVLGLFAATLAVSTLASGHPLEAGGWARLWVVATYFTVFWWLRDRRHAARLVSVLVAAGTVAAVYGVLQHFTGADWYRVLLGRERMVRPRVVGGESYAVVGFFRNYLTFAHVMLFPASWATARALRGRATGTIAAGLIVLAIVFSTARGAWLALLGVAVVLALMTNRRRAGRVLAALGVVAVLAFAVSPELRTEAAGMFSTGGDNAGRVGIYRANLDIIHDHPVLGLGFGRYATAALPFYAAHPEADRHSHAHNDYLQIAAEAGLVGLAAFVLLYAVALRLGWEAVAEDADGWTAAGAWAGVLGFLIGGLTQYNFGDNEVALAMWLALAVLMRCREG